jgi:hypothetical protein
MGTTRSGCERVQGVLKSEALDAVVISVENMECSLGVTDEPPRLCELAFRTSGSAANGQGFPFPREFLNPMIAKLANINMSLLVKHEVVGIAELSRFAAMYSPMTHDLYRVLPSIKDLDAMVARVHDPDVILFIDLQVLGPSKSSNFTSRSSPLKQEITVGVKLLNSIKLAVLGDVEISLGILDRVRHEVKFARSESASTTQGFFLLNQTVGPID